MGRSNGNAKGALGENLGRESPLAIIEQRVGRDIGK
jgi:hypothetical protein